MTEVPWRRIGVLLPPMNVAMEPDMNSWTPDGVTVHATRLYRSEAITGVAQLQEMLEGLEEDVRRLAFTRPDIIVYGCTSGSSLEPHQDQEIASKIEAASRIQAIATAGAVVDALRALETRRVAVATPYVDEVNQREMAFLAEHGFEPVNLEALRLSNSYDIAEVTQERLYRLALAADRPEADALFVSCTNLRTSSLVDRLEHDLGKPVVTSNQASMWLALRMIGVTQRIPGGGRLMQRGMASKEKPIYSPANITAT